MGKQFSAFALSRLLARAAIGAVRCYASSPPLLQLLDLATFLGSAR